MNRETNTPIFNQVIERNPNYAVHFALFQAYLKLRPSRFMFKWLEQDMEY